jgi:Na+-translocating ferredoxin:NAD+ oxidoreductase RnfG subunit
MMRANFLLVPLWSMAVFGGPAFAAVYLTVGQAQSVLFPDATFQPDNRTLSDQQVKAIERASGVPVRNRQLRMWRVSTGGWFIADEVVGKHEFIPFALGLDSQGAVKGVEILEYREAYGGQIRDAKWRQQFVAKAPGAKLRLEKDIRNISGATLSCIHVTDGVNRLLATYETLFNPPGR